MKIKKNRFFSDAFEYLKNHHIMFIIIQKFEDKITIKNRYNSNYSKTISELIIEQQVSFKAAINIKKN